jgi:HEAT repeat protein
MFNLVPTLRRGNEYFSIFKDSAVKKFQLLTCLLMAAAVVWIGNTLSAADDAGDSLVDAIVGLLSDKDKDMRAIGLQQVREEVKGEAATKRFVDSLPKLSPEAQAALIGALATRGDKTARPAILEMIKSNDGNVRTAVLNSLGLLGDATDVPLLVKSLTSSAEAEKSAAQRSLEQLVADGTDAKIVEELKTANNAKLQTALILIVERRKMPAGVPMLLELAISDNADIRTAAMQTLGQLAGAEDIPKMLQGLLKTESGAQREAAEKAVMFVCQRNKDAEKRVEPLLAAWEKLNDEQKTVVLPAIGRVGGSKALMVVDKAIASENAQRRDAGVRALCNWPDASVVDALLKLAQSSDNPSYRLSATRALPRVAVLKDSRSDAERLDLLKKIMNLATRDAERNLVLDRAKAIRTMDAVRYVLSNMDNPELAQRACATIVELAHYRELRDPNKAEFDKALDKVIDTCKDPVLVDRAKRYKRGETVEIRSKIGQ